MNLLTFDFGGTFVKYCLMNDQAEISEHGQLPAPLKTKDDFLDLICRLYEQYLDKTDCIAISMPGVIDSEKGDIILVALYPEMSGQNICRLLKDRIPVPISVENDGKAAILAEAWKGALANVSDAACILLGSGIGGGIIMGGRLQKGYGFAAGEISDLLVGPGCYEKENTICYDSSMSGFLKAVARAKNMDPACFEISGNASREEKRISGMDVFQWIEAEDPPTLTEYRKWIQRLAWLLYNIKLTVSPEKIVIGGGVSRNERFIRDLKEEYQKAVSKLASYLPETAIDTCRFQADANLVGAAYNWILMHGNHS